MSIYTQVQKSFALVSNIGNFTVGNKTFLSLSTQKTTRFSSLEISDSNTQIPPSAGQRQGKDDNCLKVS